MIQVYADGTLAYDSRLDKYNLVGLKITTGLNVGGTAEIIMPVGHPAYNLFVSYKTKVTIYRDGKLRFRGRALYPDDTFYGQRTITCEGELCFLRDSVQVPYLYQDSPAAIFGAVITDHYRWMQFEPDKYFKVGEVTVTDPNEYIRLESDSAETSLATINKLLDRCGGYIVFSGTGDTRTINWYATLDQHSSQQIEFGENLLDFTRTGALSTSLITGLFPYGAKDETTGKRLTVESVNGGMAYIVAEDAVAVRGLIMDVAVWDEVTDPSNLLKKAQAYLEERKSYISSLVLTAIDLSAMDKSIDQFTVGDLIRVISVPHGVNDFFQLTQMTEDLLNPAASQITLGKDVQSLTHATVTADIGNWNAATSARSNLKADYSAEIRRLEKRIEEMEGSA